MNKGIWYAIGAYVAWGLIPIYFKWLGHVPALQIVSHRILWSLLLLVAYILFARQWLEFRAAIANMRAVRVHVASTALLSVNWLVYVWGVNSGYIVETSLGYFINPLVSVVMGVLFLHERLRFRQWVAAGLALCGVVYLAFDYGSPPWIALTLAITFATYGLVKKTAPLGPLYGLTLETGILFLPALVFLVFTDSAGQGAFLHTGLTSDILLVCAGLVTTAPLLMFASAAQRIPLSLLGILQYIAPTLQFLLGVLLYKEPFTQSRFTGFAIVWAALIIFWIDGIAARRVSTVRTG
jgi:chloramphenicol-sensitive protein RarD